MTESVAADCPPPIQRVFAAPGEDDAATAELCACAAAAHASLLRHAVASTSAGRLPAVQILSRFLNGAATPAMKRALLCDPLLIEGLHALAPECPALQRWHAAVAPPAPHARPGLSADAARARLGATALALLLRDDPSWQGTIDVATDMLGRLGFPFCDWTLAISTAPGEMPDSSHDRGSGFQPAAGRVISACLSGREARCSLAGAAQPILVMARHDFVRAIAGNDESLELEQLHFPDPAVKVRWQFARRFEGSEVRYDPAAFADFKAHAGRTGGLIEGMLAAIRSNAPGVYRELCALIRTVRGFELPATTHGEIESFSDPAMPGIMNINVNYARDGDPLQHQAARDHQPQPCLSSFFFTNIGHELGHTRHYLIDTVLHVAGQSLVSNPGDTVGPIARYGRPLGLRTLMQIPYVHLYEWALLMDFVEGGFRDLPWEIGESWRDFGDDVAAEIDEAFAALAAHARLTPLGVHAVDHLRALHQAALARWRAIAGL